MKIFSSIKSKMLTFGLSISLIPIVIITTIYYFHTRSILRQKTFQDLQMIVQAKRLHVLDCIEAERIHTSDFSIDNFIREELRTITQNEVSMQNTVTNLNNYLSNALKIVPAQPHLVAVTIVDKFGKVISSTNEKLIGRDISHDEAFIQGIMKRYGETFVSQPHFSSYYDINCICISAPIISDNDTKPLGAIINTYNLSFLNEITANLIGIGNTGEVYLVNKDNKTMITKSKFVENLPLKQTINTMPIRKIIEENKEWGGIYPDYRGIPVIGVSMDIPEYNWILMAKIDKSEVFAPLKTSNTIVLTLGIICAAVVTSVGVTFALSASRPIVDLRDVTEKFTKGDLDYRINIIRNDEIGNLSKSFNIMAEELANKINELKQIAEVLHVSESKCRFLYENLPLRIFYKDRNLVYQSCNENYARDLHIMPEEITGKTDYDFFSKELSEKYRTDDREVIESGYRKDIEDTYIINRQELIVHTIKIPIKNEKGECVGILGASLDITEKVNLEKEIQLSRHLALIGELAAGVAHEINNPITGIINCAQMLSNKASEGSREKDLTRRIIKEGDRIAHIVSKLLSFARTKDKKEQSIMSVHEIVSDALILTGPQLRKEGTKIKLDMPEDLPKILANSQEIHQVFLNLTNNARYALNQKYPGRHDDKILEILGEKIAINSHSYVKITFYDHGTGIPAHIRDKVMNPFFTTKPAGEGTGLGLSICHNIINDHGGKLTIDSAEGKFTSISIILPVS
ncbi:MAG: PAS domain-containing protein [Candidatus Jettenia caeni]|nr:MAG: PAS domain-containing protein [Candidatus Jettenia caeni]